MTKRIDPEIKAMGAIVRALEEINDPEVRRRILSWVIAVQVGDTWHTLPAFPAAPAPKCET